MKLHARLMCGSVAALLTLPAAAFACIKSMADDGSAPARQSTYVQADAGGGSAARCTVDAADGDVREIKAGDTVCFTGKLATRLRIERGGSEGTPITYAGQGVTSVPGITVQADHVVIDGFKAEHAEDNGIWASGDDITIRDNEISGISRTDDDVDAIRFFGDDITISRNWAHDVWANPGDGDPHVDCMQTFAHAEPASSRVRIEGNRCEGLQSQCVMAEGPHDFEDGASGAGESRDWLITGNHFECHAEAQTIQLQDIQNVTFSKNTFAGAGNKAIALGLDATGATVTADNVLGCGYDKLVDFDDESAREGFRGPGEVRTCAPTPSDEHAQPVAPSEPALTPAAPQPAADTPTAAQRLGWGRPLPESDEFDYTGAPDPKKWSAPDGCWPGHAGNGRRCAERSEVKDGKLVMTGLANGDTGWLGSRLQQRYGRWEARVRSVATGSEGGGEYHPLLIVWPDSDRWPEDGEYDFLENDRPGEPCAEAFLHYPHPKDEAVQQEQAKQAAPCGAPLSEWHNVAFEWTPDHIKGFIDGQEWFSFAGGEGPHGRAAMQSMPSGHLTIQLDDLSGEDMRAATYEVDWARMYSVR